MDDYSQINFYLYLVLLVTGLVLIFISLLKKNPWILKRAEIRINRLGIDLHVENRTLFIFLGVILLLSTGYFIFQNDQEILDNAEEAKKEKMIAIKNLNLAEDNLKRATDDLIKSLNEETFAMSIVLLLDKADEEVNLSESTLYSNINFNVSLYRSNGDSVHFTHEMLRKGIAGFRLDELVDVKSRLLTVNDVKRDDKLEIVATYENLLWRREIVIPNLHCLLMKMPINKENDDD